MPSTMFQCSKKALARPGHFDLELPDSRTMNKVNFFSYKLPNMYSVTSQKID
jgi:hypothetical protein